MAGTARRKHPCRRKISLKAEIFKSNVQKSGLYSRYEVISLHLLEPHILVLGIIYHFKLLEEVLFLYCDCIVIIRYSGRYLLGRAGAAEPESISAPH